MSVERLVDVLYALPPDEYSRVKREMASYLKWGNTAMPEIVLDAMDGRIDANQWQTALARVVAKQAYQRRKAEEERLLARMEAKMAQKRNYMREYMRKRRTEENDTAD